jgi:hypothetical protein
MGQSTEFLCPQCPPQPVLPSHMHLAQSEIHSWLVESCGLQLETGVESRSRRRTRWVGWVAVANTSLSERISSRKKGLTYRTRIEVIVRHVFINRLGDQVRCVYSGIVEGIARRRGIWSVWPYDRLGVCQRCWLSMQLFSYHFSAAKTRWTIAIHEIKTLLDEDVFGIVIGEVGGERGRIVGQIVWE